MGTEIEFERCPKCNALIAVVVEEGNTRCGKCWEGLIQYKKPDQDGGAE